MAVFTTAKENFRFAQLYHNTIMNIEEEVTEANLENKAYDTFLSEILEREYELRKENVRKSRIRLAKFPYKRYIENLVLEDLPEDARNKVKIFSTLEFIKIGQNIILEVNPGTGKTHMGGADVFLDLKQPTLDFFCSLMDSFLQVIV